MKAKTLLLAAFALSAVLTHAQPWMETVKSAQPTFTEIQTAFNAYWKNRPVEKGKGYKTFRRWEWFWQHRLLSDSSFPSPSINRDELSKYRRTHPQTQTGKIKSANWVFKGPTTSAGGYFGLGRINTIAFHPTNANIFWVGTPSGGLWKTTDGGTSWSSNTDNLGVLGVSGIVINPTDPNIMYIATGDGDGADTYSSGVLKSIDGGNTWVTTGLQWTPTNTALIRRLVMNPADPQMLFAAANGLLLRTTNGGTNWSNVKSGSFYDVEFHPTDPAIVYAAAYDNASTSALLYTSTNAGTTWTVAATLPGVRRVNLAVTPAAPNVVQALATNTAAGLAGIWTSTNSGASYTQTLTGTNSNNLLHSSNNGSGSGGQGFYDLSFVINPSNANELWVGGVNTWSSTDGGANWTLKNFWNTSSSAPIVHADKHFFAFHPLSSTTLFECNDGGLYKTTNGGTSWTNLSNGLGISQIYRIGLSATVADRVLAGLQDNSTKRLQGTTWAEAVSTGDGFESIIDYNNANIMYTSSYYGHIFKSTNGGSNWSEILDNEGIDQNEEGAWLTPYVMHPTTSTTLIVGKAQVYQTTDAGTTWTQLGALPVVTSALVSALAYAPSDPQTIYVATNSPSGNRVYKSINGGSVWTQIYTPTQFVGGLAVHPLNPQQLWITQAGYSTGNKVFTSADGGTTWTNFSGTLPNVPVNCIVYQNGTADGLYIGTDLGVFYRDNNEADWGPYQNGLPNVIVNELEISYNTNKLWAATFGRGLWNTDLNAVPACTSPAAPASGGNLTVCQSAVPVTLSATAPSGTVVDWYSASAGGTLLQASSNTISVSAAGNYFAESRNTTTGCKSSSRTAVTLTINPAPVPTVSTSGATTFCQGGSVTLTSSATSGNQWYKNGTAINNATNQTHTATEPGTYTVTATTGTCTSGASANTTVTVNLLPSQPTITLIGGVLQSSATSGNQWYLNGVALPLNANNQTYTPTATGQYTVVSTINGCPSPASVQYAFAITSINSPELDNAIVIAPNPVSTNLLISYKGNAARFQVRVLDISGKQVLHQGTFTATYSLDMHKYSAGAYIIHITNERSKEHIQRMIMKK